MKTTIEFRAIPNPNKQGKICLTIYPPHQFMNNEGYETCVGGCGVGEYKTLEAARIGLLLRAKKECEYRMDEALKDYTHYGKQLRRLNKHGLEKEKVVKE